MAGIYIYIYIYICDDDDDDDDAEHTVLGAEDNIHCEIPLLIFSRGSKK